MNVIEIGDGMHCPSAPLLNIVMAIAVDTGKPAYQFGCTVPNPFMVLFTVMCTITSLAKRS